MPSTLAIVVVLIIIIITFVESLKEDDTVFAKDTIIVVQAGTNVFDFLQSLSSVMFAFQGQSIFMELMTETKNPKEFSKSCNLAYIIMGVVYAAVVVLAYMELKAKMSTQSPSSWREPGARKNYHRSANPFSYCCRICHRDTAFSLLGPFRYF